MYIAYLWLSFMNYFLTFLFDLIFEDETKMKGFKNALEDGVKMNISAYLALLPTTNKNGGNTVFISISAIFNE